MKKDYNDIVKILVENPEGVILDKLLVNLGMECTNINRVNLTSRLSWCKEIKKVYITEDGKVKTKYKLK